MTQSGAASAGEAEARAGAAARAPAPRRRIAAAVALAIGGATAATVVLVVLKNPLAGAGALVGLALAVRCAWEGALVAGAGRRLWFSAAAVAVVSVLAVLGTTGLIPALGIVLVGVLVVAGAVRVAFGDRGAAGGHWTRASTPARPVLLINPHSGRDAAVHAGLVDEAHARRVETVVLSANDDLEDLARQAVARGADMLGMAGGDGSMSTVAAVAAEHDLPFACIPAGTRNHFALDLGVRRYDVVGALDAFSDGLEARVDLAEVNGRVFVNNVSLGIYGDAVQHAEYRTGKLRTLLDSARDQLGPGGPPSAMRLTDDRGVEHRTAVLVLVSNNPYALDRSLGSSTRPRLDAAQLGIIVVDGPGGNDRVWESPTFATQSVGDDRVAAAIDGEAATLEATLRFATLPAALRVRISPQHPGVSPSGLLPPRLSVVVPRLVRLATHGQQAVGVPRPH